MLQLAKIDFTMAPPQADRVASAPMLMQMLEMEFNKPGPARFVPEAEPPETTRVLEVMGQESPFKFSKGRFSETRELAWKVSGTFPTETGLVALIYVAPENEYDEQAVIRMIESIGPAEDDLPTESEPG
jgi:hypothetical protein